MSSTTKWSAKGSGENKIDPYSYVINILDDSHVNDATEIFTKSFCKYEPLVKSLNISEDDFRPLAKEIVTQAAYDQLSVVATDKKGKIVGLSIGENFHEPAEISEFPMLNPVFALFEELSTPMKNMRLEQNSVAHIWITAIDESIQGAGLSTRLNNACVIRSIDQGFRYVYCEFTNELNERIMKYFPDSILLNKIEVSKFKWNDTNPFKDVKGHASAYIFSAAPYNRIDALKVNVSKAKDRVAQKTQI